MDSAGCFSKLGRLVLPLAYFGIESSGLNLVVSLLIVFVTVLYFSLIYWTYTDARRRIVDPMLVGCSTAASLFPFVGTMVYMILRPPEYLEDVRERELELHAAELRLHDLEQGLCPHCDYRVEPDFVRCPSCLRKLKERCVSCSRPLDQAWTICPYCETEVPGAISSRRTRRRRSSSLEDEGGPVTEDDLTQIGGTGAKGGGPVTRRGDEGARPAHAAPPEPAVRPHSSAGRASRPGGRPRPTS
jgi:Double zinc ribbon